VQVPAGQLGVVIAQVGEPLPTGAKSAIYKPVFGQFSELDAFVNGGGQKGVAASDSLFGDLGGPCRKSCCGNSL